MLNSSPKLNEKSEQNREKKLHLQKENVDQVRKHEQSSL